MSYGYYPRYVSVAEKKAKATKKIKELRKKNPNLQPVILPGQALATTWWGKAWNKNLERYADYSNRIGRGRSYVRHMAVLDLQISPGRIESLVAGSARKPYKVTITISRIKKGQWQGIKEQSSQQLSSLPDLLAGKFPKDLQEIFMAKGQGLFPRPAEISLACDCPDWATMCKHVAATLYGVGARLDEDPSLLFTLRKVAIDDLVAQAVQAKTASILEGSAKGSKIISDDNLAGLFGINMDEKIDFNPSAKPKRGGVNKVKARPKTGKAVPRQRAGDQLADLLLAIIDEYGEEISVKDLAEISGQPAKKLYSILARLKKDAEVVSCGYGKYCSTSAASHLDIR